MTSKLANAPHHSLPLLCAAPLLVLLCSACDPDVDLGGSDAATPVDAGGGDVAVPDPRDAGVSPDASVVPDAPALDASAPDVPTTPGEPLSAARQVLFDVIDGTEAFLTLRAQAWAGVGRTRGTATALRLELLDSSGGVVESYPLGDVDLEHQRDGALGPEFESDITVAVPVTDTLRNPCGSDAYWDRMISLSKRLVVDMDGTEVATIVETDLTVYTTPPRRAVVLCHDGIDVDRRHSAWDGAWARFALHTDGSYSYSNQPNNDERRDGTYELSTATPVLTVDLGVRVSTIQRFTSLPARTFDLPSDCASPCTLSRAMHRTLTSAVVPMALPDFAGSPQYLCAEPEIGEPRPTDDAGWQSPSRGRETEAWLCRDGDQRPAIMRFTGTTEDGAFAVELFSHEAFWAADGPPR